MSMPMKPEPIKLKIEKSNGIKYEKMDEFYHSLCRNVYYDAFVKTQQLIENNENYKKEGHW